MKAWEAFKALQEGTCKRVRDNHQRHWSWGEWGPRCEGSSIAFGPQAEPFVAADTALTVEDVRNAVVKIGASAPDHDEQQCLEGALYLRVLEAVRDGHQQSRDLATEALKSQQFFFVRAYG